MPTFNLRCRKCNKTVEFFGSYKQSKKEVCECGGKMERLWEGGGNIGYFKPKWYHHLGPEPVFIESIGHLKRECAKRDMYANIG